MFLYPLSKLNVLFCSVAFWFCCSVLYSWCPTVFSASLLHHREHSNTVIYGNQVRVTPRASFTWGIVHREIPHNIFLNWSIILTVLTSYNNFRFVIKIQNGKVQRVQMKLKIYIVTNMPPLISIPRQRFSGSHNCCGWATPAPWSSKTCTSYQRKRKQNTSLRSSVISMQVNRYADTYKIYLLWI